MTLHEENRKNREGGTGAGTPIADLMFTKKAEAQVQS